MLSENFNVASWIDLNIAAEQRASSLARAHMPSLDHLSYQDYENIYEPAEDTYLFLDALKDELEQLHHTIAATTDQVQSGRCVLCLEIGCGSGVISTFASNRWNELNDGYDVNESIPMINFATDINPRALFVTRQTFHQNKLKNHTNYLEVIRCDLSSSLLSRFSNMCDIVLFNPPYVPTPDEEVNVDGDIAAAWAGGEDGRRVIDRFVPQLAQILKRPTGIAYMVTVDDNKPFELACHLSQKYHLIMRPIFRRRAKNEFLTIQKITCNESTD
jgi:release factor glutamine methyltransferase